LRGVLLLLLAGCAASPPTTIAVPSQETRAAAAGWQDGRPWIAQHQDGVAIAARGPWDLYFLGDSITQSWGGPGRRVSAPAREVWKEEFGHLRSASLGISGDRTQHLLWRIENGALDGADPQVIVVMIGTNNLPHDNADQIARGIEAVVEAVLRHAPDAQVLLHPILPRGGQPDHPMRKKGAAVNRAIVHLEARDRLTIVDLEPHFTREDRSQVAELFRGDHLHLAIPGYRMWARTLRPHLIDLGLSPAR